MTSKETMGQEQGLVTRKDLRKMAVNTGALGMEYSWNYPKTDECGILSDDRADPAQDL